MLRISQQDFLLSELAKVFNEEENLSKLSAFLFFVWKFRLSPHLRAQNDVNFQTVFGYSIVKYL